MKKLFEQILKINIFILYIATFCCLFFKNKAASLHALGIIFFFKDKTNFANQNAVTAYILFTSSVW